MHSDIRRPDGPCNTRVAQRWQHVRILKDVRELNEHVLDVLSGFSEQPLGAAGSAVGYESLWRSLDADARWRAAQMPFLFLDLRFQDTEWWQGILASDDLGAADTSDPGYERTWQSQLTGQVLMLAWAAARADALSASLLFGMAQPVVEIVGALSPKEVERLGRLVCPAMSLRFCESGHFWRRLVMTARRNDMAGLREVHLYGLRLLGGEMLRRRTYSEACGRQQRVDVEGVSRSRRVIVSQVVSTD